MFKKILVAGRTESALRVIRACKEMGIQTVAVFSEPDKDSMHVYAADEAICIGPANSGESYLNIASIVSAALVAGCDAVHPCIGFLAENDKFAQAVIDNDMTFIGPSPAHIRQMGDKIEAKKAAKAAGLNLIPGSPDTVADENAVKIAREIGYPVLIKATAGGAGRGIRVVHAEENLMSEIQVVRQEAKAAFGSDEIYIEKFLESPKHIEIQIIADKYGNVCHLGERECSIQRRYQKIWEETPSPSLTDQERQKLFDASCEAVKNLGYLGVGTIEFLYEKGGFYFMEMNTRLQVEHTISEMVTGIDLVQEQISVAAGNKLSFGQNDIEFRGVAVECRINAENEDFIPSPGRIDSYIAPGGFGVRVDSHAYSGYMVNPHYDNLVSKLIVHGADREKCVAKVRRALDEYVISGISTNIPLHKKLADSDEVLKGQYSIKWLENKLKEGF
jgi:acetyl-CoA carboxylase, biotin carboxylase subunit